MIVRPVTSADLPALIELARSTGTGLTTLPANEQRLQHRVSWAEKAFRGEAERGDADLFVLEDDAGKVVGISAIAGAVGLREPWYNYRVGLTVSASQELNIHREIPTLFLANDLTGNSELCSLFLHANHRSGLNGKLLSRARFLFIAEFRHLFGDKLIAEMRGMSDEEGRSPFWESLGRHFFKMEFSQADYLTGVGNKAFIAELMPKFPLTPALRGGARRPRPSGAGAPCSRPKHQTPAGDRGRDRQDPRHRREPEPGAGGGHSGDDAEPYLIHNRKREDCRITAAPARPPPAPWWSIR